MSGAKNSSLIKSGTALNKKKPYHFFTLPTNCLLEGELTKIGENCLKQLHFSLHEDVILFYEV